MEFSQIHTRSISLPSRLHPLNSNEFEAEVEKLKSSQSPSSLSSHSIISSLVGLAELYNSMDELKSTPKLAEGALEGSVELLDSCGCIREVAQMMKESIRALHSALRRKGAGLDVQNDVISYIGSRKRMSKCIKKSLKALKGFEGRIHASDALREVYGLTAAVFRSALLFFSYSSAAAGWSRVARAMMLKKSRDDHGGVVSEVGCVDFALGNGGFDKQMVQMSLQILDFSIDGIEAALEAMFRQLLQSRVNLLNFVTNH